MLTHTSFFLFLLSSALALRCKNIPGDPLYPSQKQWDAFNRTVDGRLIKTIPLAAPCHANNPFGVPSSQEACDNVKNSWHRADIHLQSSFSILSAPFTNRSCDPFQADLPCSTGTYVEYAVNVSTKQHVIDTVKFAKSQNIRFVVRNTGHDYMGKSTGHGALAIWMFNLKKTKWIEKSKSLGYNGPAVKMHSGVSMSQAYQEASAHGFSVIGGDCPTVGVGGFVQGGGVGFLSTLHGTLADDVIEYKVITTTGRIVKASPFSNPDLYWALSGGGPGTYGIIWSVTVKVRPDLTVPGATLTFSTSDSVSLDTWWEGVNAYRAMVGDLVKAGGYALAVYTQGSFQLRPATLPNKTLDDFSVIFDPFLQQLNNLSIDYNVSKASFPNFFEAHSTWLPESLPIFDVQNLIAGSWLLPVSLWKSPKTLAPVNAAVRAIVDDGGGVFDIAVHPAKTVPSGFNSVFPPWRNTLTEMAIFIPWNDTGSAQQVVEQQRTMTKTYIKSLKALAPDSGAYLQEADPNDPNWKQDFYGINYDRLLFIKDIWDPDQLLYGSTAVGGDRWVLEADGRLCPR